MSTFSHHFRTAPFLLSAAIVCALSVSTFGGAGADNPTTPTAAIANVASGNGSSGDVVSGDASRSCANSARPSQTREEKVYPNEEVAGLRKNYGASTVGNGALDNPPS